MVEVFSFAEAAGSRPNEDAFAVGPHPLDPNLIVGFVADGQGGRTGGARAARLACQTGMERAASLSPEQLLDRLVWAGLVRLADEAVGADAEAGLTTLVGFCATAGRVVGASCGDSAALLVAGGHATELTRDQRKDPPVGSGTAEGVTFGAMADAPWRLVVMTDGVWKYVGWGRVIEAARRDRGATLLADLDRAARLPGSGRFPDDFTVVLLESGPSR